MQLAEKIIKYMEKENYEIFTNEGQANIIYIEGMNPDGTLNNDAPNQFNDLRLILTFRDTLPIIINWWQATTEPGSKYTYQPVNPKGAARIQFGQYQAWRVGLHGNKEKHEALIQVLPITVCRDFNQDFKRTGDKLDTGFFGINQHHGYDYPENNIGLASAGCLVGRTRKGHKEFMKIIKKDWRYEKDSNFIFTTTIIPGDKL